MSCPKKLHKKTNLILHNSKIFLKKLKIFILKLNKFDCIDFNLHKDKLLENYFIHFNEYIHVPPNFEEILNIWTPD